MKTQYQHIEKAEQVNEMATQFLTFIIVKPLAILFAALYFFYLLILDQNKNRVRVNTQHTQSNDRVHAENSDFSQFTQTEEAELEEEEEEEQPTRERQWSYASSLTTNTKRCRNCGKYFESNNEKNVYCTTKGKGNCKDAYHNTRRKQNEHQL
jgi:hypothetical protein